MWLLALAIVGYAFSHCSVAGSKVIPMARQSPFTWFGCYSIAARVQRLGALQAIGA